MTTTSEIRLRLNPWLANAVEYWASRTQMDYTTITKLALMEFIQRRFTKYDFETIQDLMDGVYKDALDEWVHWNMFLREIPKDQSTLWKKLAIKSLEYMQGKKHMPLYTEFYKLGEWIKLDKKYEAWLIDFLFYQFKIIEYHGKLPLPEDDKYKSLLNEEREEEYYKHRWNEYAEHLIAKMGDMAHPLFNILYQIKVDHSLVTDRETALFLLKHIIKNKAIQRSERPHGGPYGPTSDHLDSGEVAQALLEGKIKNGESIEDFLNRRAWEESDREVKRLEEEMERAERVMKNISPRSYAISKRTARKFADEQAGRDPNAKEKQLARELLKRPKEGIIVDSSEVDEETLFEEIDKLEDERHAKKQKKKKK